MIPGVDYLGLFVVAGLLLNLTPGPDVLFIVSQGLRSGARAGVVAALGISAGCLVHVVAAKVGVGALVAASATAFTVLKWIGAAYLVFIGLRMLANAINPKVALFFLAFLPQFVVPTQGPVAAQLGLLGLLFTAQAAVLFGLLGWFSGHVGAWLQRVPGSARVLDRLAGTVFIGLGLRLVASR